MEIAATNSIDIILRNSFWRRCAAVDETGLGKQNKEVYR